MRVSDRWLASADDRSGMFLLLQQLLSPLVTNSPPITWHCLRPQGDYAYAFDFFTTSMLWTVIAAALVFLMHLGFATLEAGLTQSKNTVNILFKNVFIISIGLISYAIIGFNTHYPGDFQRLDRFRRIHR